MTHKKKGKVGSSFDDFLAEQGILEECEEQAVKQILADQIKAAMEKDRLTKAAMAIRMRTSRRALDRLLDPSNSSVTLQLFNAPLWLSAANSGWNLSEKANISAS